MLVQFSKNNRASLKTRFHLPLDDFFVKMETVVSKGEEDNRRLGESNRPRSTFDNWRDNHRKGFDIYRDSDKRLDIGALLHRTHDR